MELDRIHSQKISKNTTGRRRTNATGHLAKRQGKRNKRDWLHHERDGENGHRQI